MKSAPRIVSLLPGATEIVCGLGLGENLVGISHECDFPAEVRRLPRLTSSRINSAAGSVAIDQQVRSRLETSAALYQLDADLLATLAPDVIVTQAQCDVCAVRLADVEAAVADRPQLRNTQLLSMQPASLGDVLTEIRRIGKATGREQRAEQWLNELNTRLEAVQSITQKFAPDPGPIKYKRHLAAFPMRQDAACTFPRVACIEWTEPLMLAGNWVPKLIELAGGQNGLTQSGQHSPYVDWRTVVAYDPEVLVVAPCGFDLPRTLQELPSLFGLPGWSTLSAVKSGKVFAIDGNAYFNRCGPRLVDTVEILAHLFHPAYFAAKAEEAWSRVAVNPGVRNLC